MGMDQEIIAYRERENKNPELVVLGEWRKFYALDEAMQMMCTDLELAQFEHNCYAKVRLTEKLIRITNSRIPRRYRGECQEDGETLSESLARLRYQRLIRVLSEAADYLRDGWDLEYRSDW